MWIKKKVVKEVETIDGFICNKCKKEVTNEIDWQEGLYWINHAGYNSVFGDGNTVSIHLCQECVKELLGDYLECKEN